MARPKSEIPVLMDRSEADAQTGLENSEAQQLILSTKNNIAKINEFFGGVYNREANERGLKVDAELMNLSSLSFGGRLQCALEHDGREYYLDLLQKFNIGERQGAQLRQTFARFHSRPDFSRLAATKLITLAVLEDDVLDQIENSSIVDAKISDLDRMTVRELKAKVTELREENHAKTARLTEARTEKDAALDKLQARDRALEDKQARTGALFGMLETASMRLISSLKEFSDARTNFSTHLSDTKTIISEAQEDALDSNIEFIRRWLDHAEISVFSLDQAVNGGIPL